MKYSFARISPKKIVYVANQKIKLLDHYIRKNLFDIDRSFVIGDRETDMQLAENLGIRAIQYDPQKMNWDLIAEKLLGKRSQIVANVRHVLQK